MEALIQIRLHRKGTIITSLIRDQSTYYRTIEHKFNKEWIHFLESEASKHLDILLIYKTKIDESFPSTQFLLDGFSRPYRLDHYINDVHKWDTSVCKR